MKGKTRKFLTGMLVLVILFQQMTGCAPVRELEVRQDKQQNKQAEAEGKVEEIARISEGKYAYKRLSKQEQQIYDEILSVILNYQGKSMLSCTDSETMRKAYIAVCADYEGLFWIDGYKFTKYTKGEEVFGLEFEPNYTMTEEECQRTQKKIDDVVEQWLVGISINDTDYNKVKYVYDLLSTNTKYVEGAENSQNIISVFLNGETVCQGYACAAQYLMRQLGVESVIVSGEAMGQAHAWNLFQMDGEYYYMDVTWGRGRYTDDDGTENFFVDYKYMAMTSEEMLRSHIPDEVLELPICTSQENNYFRKEGNYIEEWNAEEIGKRITKAWEEQSLLTLRFADNELYKQVKDYFIEEGNIAKYCEGAESISYIIDDTWLEIIFCFQN